MSRRLKVLVPGLTAILVICVIIAGILHHSGNQPNKKSQPPGTVGIKCGFSDAVGKADVRFLGKNGTAALVAVLHYVSDSEGRFPPVQFIVEQEVPIGFAFPVYDQVFRVVDASESNSKLFLYVQSNPVTSSDFVPTARSIGLPLTSRCHIESEKLRFDVQSVEPDHNAGSVDRCWVVIHPSNSLRKWLPEPAPADSQRILARPGQLVRLNSNLVMQLLRIVPRDESMKFGGWAEFQLLSGQDVIDVVPNTPII